MKIHPSRIVLPLAIACAALAAAPAQKPAFTFRNTEFFHRWSKNNQHEFTPANQENLEKWTDMMTINAYPDTKDGDRLADRANAVLENYKRHEAKVLKTTSVPRTPDHPAEHLITVMFTRPGFAEIAFARLKLIDGKGFSLVYSHRLYVDEPKAADAWVGANAREIEKALMEWNSIPSEKELNGPQERTPQ